MHDTIDLKGPKTKQYKLHYNDIRGDFYGRKPAHHQISGECMSVDVSPVNYSDSDSD